MGATLNAPDSSMDFTQGSEASACVLPRESKEVSVLPRREDADGPSGDAVESETASRDLSGDARPVQAVTADTVAQSRGDNDDELFLGIVLEHGPFQASARARTHAWDAIAKAYVAVGGNQDTSRVDATRRLALLTLTLLETPECLCPAVRGKVLAFHERNLKAGFGKQLGNLFIATLRYHATHGKRSAPIATSRPQQNSLGQMVELQKRALGDEQLLRLALEHRPFEASKKAKVTHWITIANAFNKAVNTTESLRNLPLLKSVSSATQRVSSLIPAGPPAEIRELATAFHIVSLAPFLASYGLFSSTKRISNSSSSIGPAPVVLPSLPPRPRVRSMGISVDAAAVSVVVSSSPPPSSISLSRSSASARFSSSDRSPALLLLSWYWRIRLRTPGVKLCGRVAIVLIRNVKRLIALLASIRVSLPAAVMALATASQVVRLASSLASNGCFFNTVRSSNSSFSAGSVATVFWEARVLCNALSAATVSSFVSMQRWLSI